MYSLFFQYVFMQMKGLSVGINGLSFKVTERVIISFDSPLNALSSIFWVRVDQVKRSVANNFLKPQRLGRNFNSTETHVTNF